MTETKVIRSFGVKNGNVFPKKGHSKIWCAKFFPSVPPNSAPGLCPCRLAYLLPTNILFTLYYSLISPYLTYSNVIWASNYTSRLYTIIVLEKRIFSSIMCLPYTSLTGSGVERRCMGCDGPGHPSGRGIQLPNCVKLKFK